MTHHNHFLIRNDSVKPLTLNVEPEGAFLPLAKGEEVSVSEAFQTAPLTLKLSIADDGGPILSLWPGDGEVKVVKAGVDVFDLIEKSERTRLAEGGKRRNSERAGERERRKTTRLGVARTRKVSAP